MPRSLWWPQLLSRTIWSSAHELHSGTLPHTNPFMLTLSHWFLSCHSRRLLVLQNNARNRLLDCNLLDAQFITRMVPYNCQMGIISLFDILSCSSFGTCIHHRLKTKQAGTRRKWMRKRNFAYCIHWPDCWWYCAICIPIYLV